MRITKCSKIGLQIDFGRVFYTKPHQKITPDSLVTSKLIENLKIRPKSTRKFLVGVGGKAKPLEFAQKRLLLIDNLCKTNYSKPSRQPYASLASRVHLKPRNSILNFENYAGVTPTSVFPIDPLVNTRD